MSRHHKIIREKMLEQVCGKYGANSSVTICFAIVADDEKMEQSFVAKLYEELMN
jgi:hypothetical protein